MGALLITIVVGLVGGIAAGFQSPLTGLMGRRIGDLGSVFFTYGGGALLILAIVLLTQRDVLNSARGLPWYAFLAGPLGLVVIGGLSYTVPRLGATSAMMLFIVASLIVSVVIDHFGLLDNAVRSFDVVRAVGVVALLTGTWLVIR